MNTSTEIYEMSILPGFSWIDLLSVFLMFSLGLYSVYLFKKKRNITSPFYWPFLGAKMIALFAFVGLYYFYFEGGDTFAYFMGGEQLRNIFLESPSEYFQLIFSANSNLKPLFSELLPYTGYKSDYSAFVMIKIISVFNIITVNSYWAISVLFCFISFFGSWIFFEGLNKMFGKLNTISSIVILFFPSVLLWTSGILKDTLCYSLLGVIIYQMAFLDILRPNYKRLFIVFISLVILFFLKFYIVVSFLLAYMLYVSVRSMFNKVTINQKIIFGLTSLIAFVVFIWDYSNNFYVYHYLLSRVKDFHDWHSVIANQGYTFNEVEYDILSLIKKIPESINVALFRPYVWEVEGVSMLIPVTEAIFLFGLGVWTIIKVNKKVIGSVKEKPELLLTVFFVLIFGFVVGLTAYSFGALSRYRVPLMPFYLVFMFKLLESVQQRVKGS